MGAFSNPPMEARFTLRFASFHPQIADPVNSLCYFTFEQNKQSTLIFCFELEDIKMERWMDPSQHLLSSSIKHILRCRAKDKRTLNPPNYLNLANGMHLHFYTSTMAIRTIDSEHIHTYNIFCIHTNCHRLIASDDYIFV